jgi:hypothetical protein
MAAERELVDVLLSERLPVDQVRLAIIGALPAGHELIELHDVWLGEPPLPGQTAAADYRIELEGRPDAALLTDAAAHLIASSSLIRPKPKGGGDYDLRPLVDHVAVEGGGADAGTGANADVPVVLRMRTRFDPERGAGRPDEVVAALAELAGAELSIGTIVRERVVLASER